MAHSSSTQNDANQSILKSPSDEQTASPAHSRLPFRRQASWVNPSARYQHVPPIDQDITGIDEDDYEDYDKLRGHGLGLSNVPQSSGASVVKRKAVTSPPPTSPDLSRSTAPLSQASTAQNTGNLGPEGEATKWATPQSSRYSLQDSAYKHTADNVRLIHNDHGHGPEACPTRGDVLKAEWGWFTYVLLALAIYSWVFSGIFLGIAVAKPRWGYRIGTSGRGSVSYDAATLLSALLSKLVELTFCTTFVATLGQILSRRAFAANKSPSKRGISIADMNMRMWIMQPGTLVTHFTGLKYVIASVLGITALAAAIAGALYTTSVEALVSPKLKFGRNETLRMNGQVYASYGNVQRLSDTCQTPIALADDAEKGTTCLQIDLAGNGFRNLDSWLGVWKSVQTSSDSVKMLSAAPRPPPTAILYDNTTVHGRWIRPSKENVTEDSAQHGRFVQNATIVMPHANVFHAAREPSNRLLQPSDLQGAGQYYLKAAVPAPGVNALCVGVSEDEISPLIGNGTEGIMPAQWPNVTTPIDALFNWSQTPDHTTTWAYPWFGKLPIEYNTVGNTSTLYGTQWVYLLAKPPATTVTNDYVVCGVRSFLYSDCSTSLFVASSGSELAVHCERDSDNWRSYWKNANDTELPLPMVVPNKDWKDIGVEWLRAVALTSGITDADASAARILTQMIPAYTNTTDTVLSPTHPSIGEALCVLSGYTLLLASDAAPFVHYWDYAPGLPPLLEEPALEKFPAILSYKDYASGGDQKWKGVFYIVLVAVFGLNTFCLICLLYYYCLYGEVTDYTEPQNLFALAINSPPAQPLAGACGGGPRGEMLGRKWFVDMVTPGDRTATPDPSTRDRASGAHFYVRYPDENDPLLGNAASAVNTPAGETGSRFSQMLQSPIMRRRGDRTSLMRPKSTGEFEVDESAAVAQYAKLTGR